MRIHSLVSLVALLLLASCQSITGGYDTGTGAETESDSTALNQKEPATGKDTPEQTGDKAPKPDKPNAEKPAAEPIFPALAPGQYCYQAKDSTETVNLRITIDALDQVTGDVAGRVHNEASSYFTDYSRELNGTIDGNNLNLDVTTWVEYDKQNEQVTWKVSRGALRTDDKTLVKADCKTVTKAFQNEAGIEADDLTSGANNVNTQTVYFEAGKSSTTVSNAVVRGDRDVYVLSAQGGQEMTIAITSLEDNAVFDVVAPGGSVLTNEVTEESLRLPHTGEYQVIVGGTRGNATYDLAIAIE